MNVTKSTVVQDVVLDIIPPPKQYLASDVANFASVYVSQDADQYISYLLTQLAELRAASELLARAADLLDEVPVVHDANFWHDYYLYSGNHMICTEEGWEPGEAKQSYLDQWVEDGGSNPILCEVNAPQPSPASAVEYCNNNCVLLANHEGNCKSLDSSPACSCKIGKVCSDCLKNYNQQAQ